MSKTLGKRIQTLRKKSGLTQRQLATQIELSLPQLVRYETKSVQPPADVLNKIANALNTNTDFLLNGTIEEKAKSSLSSSVLLQYFKAVEKMNDDDKHVVLKLIDAFITKKKVQQLAS